MSTKSYALTLTDEEADWLGQWLQDYVRDEDDEFNLNVAAIIRKKLLAVRELRRYDVTAQGTRTVHVEARDQAEAMAKARAKLSEQTGNWTVREVAERPA